VLSVVARSYGQYPAALGRPPVRVLGREADITVKPQQLCRQVYGNQEKYVLLEVEVPAAQAGTERNLASVNVSYVNMASKSPDRIARAASTRFTGSASLVESSINPAVMASAVEQIAVERNKQAVALRDQGKIEEARKVLLDNAAFLNENAVKYNSKELEEYKGKNKKDADNLAPAVWESQRKAILSEQNVRQGQQGQGQNRQ
jgi:Ca-activated chloride channel family protein